MRARSDSNELVNFTHNYTVLRLGSFQSPCHQRSERRFGGKISENKGVLPVFENGADEDSGVSPKTPHSRFRLRDFPVPLLRKNLRNLVQRVLVIGWSLPRFLAGRNLLAGGGVEAQSRAHTLLPRTLLLFSFFDLHEGRAEWFTTELTHL